MECWDSLIEWCLKDDRQGKQDDEVGGGERQTLMYLKTWGSGNKRRKVNREREMEFEKFHKQPSRETNEIDEKYFQYRNMIWQAEEEALRNTTEQREEKAQRASASFLKRERENLNFSLLCLVHN